MKQALLALLLCGLPALSRAADIAPPAVPPVLPGITINLDAKDGWKLTAKYSPPQPGRLSLLLLHGTGGRKEDWRRLAKPLFRLGYGYLALDLRGHGESHAAPEGKPTVWKKFVVSKEYNEYLNMMADLEAGVDYLVGQGIPEDRIAIIGADVGGSLGLRYAALHPKLPLVALLSPGMKYQEVTTVNAMRLYKGRPILMVYSEADKTSAHETPVLYGFAKISAGASKVTLLVAPQEHGARMLRGPVIGQIVAWLQNPIQPEVTASSATAVAPAPASSDTIKDEDEPADAAPLAPEPQ